MNLEPARILIALVATLGASLPAQSYAYSPADRYGRIEGAATAFANLGSAANGRYMLLDGQMRNRRLVIKAVAFRPSWYVTDLRNGLFKGRSWSNVSLHMSACDVTTRQRASTTFSNNPTSTPTRVFRGGMAWPHIFGLISRAPFTVRFPFGTPYRHDGSKDLCLDFDFTGGKLANGGAWTPAHVHPYLFSGAATGLTLAGQSAALSLPYQSICQDTRERYAAATRVSAATHNSRYPGKSAWNTIGLVVSSSFLNQPKLTVLGLAPDRSGTAIPGIACGRLHIDLSRPHWFFATGSSQRIYSPPLFAFRTAYVDTELYAQSMWRDSVTNRPQLSTVIGCLIPEMNPVQPPLRFTVHQADPARKARDGAILWATIPQPVIRYTW